VGEARLRQTPHGVLVRLELGNATPGVHGLHLHEIGRCDAPTFASAGGHFAPGGRQHGYLNGNGPHAGDLPNVFVPKSLRYTADYVLENVTLDPGPRSLLDEDGSALVLHGFADDYMTNPAGGAGDRLACGVIIAGAPLPRPRL
jgi:Cu-Zn family superoxide dismutase